MAFRVYTYDRFGDHCVAFGILREFVKRYGKIECYTDEKSIEAFNTNKRLFTDLKDVELMFDTYSYDKYHANFSIANTNIWMQKVDPWIKNPLLTIPDWFSTEWLFDRQWYGNAEVPYYLKWDNFFFERDIKKEKEVYYDILKLKDNQQFIFLIEDPIRNFLIDRKYIDDKYRIIEFNTYPEVNILDILYTVERAKEVHVFNTGLLTFIDLMNIKHDNLNYHKYVRPVVFQQPGLRLNWNVIN